VVAEFWVRKETTSQKKPLALPTEPGGTSNTLGKEHENTHGSSGRDVSEERENRRTWEK